MNFWIDIGGARNLPVTFQKQQMKHLMLRNPTLSDNLSEHKEKNQSNKKQKSHRNTRG